MIARALRLEAFFPSFWLEADLVEESHSRGGDGFEIRWAAVQIVASERLRLCSVILGRVLAGWIPADYARTKQLR